METDDSAQTREFSQALWRILKWTQRTVRIPSATPAFELLVALGASPRNELSYDDLEAMTNRSHRAMQYVVHDMRAMGFVEVKSGPEDRRRRLIRLSPAGMQFYREYQNFCFAEMGKLAAAGALLMPKANGMHKPPNQSEQLG